jgi:hypothetical protein
MAAVHEQQISLLARRIGLQLFLAQEAGRVRLYHLVEPESMTPIYPGGRAEGAALKELEDWLGFHWD